ncbi:MAG: hypothetical protein GTO18_17120 [Anaerolineales bacterium]|nr:hypothetical protein [Anaerolineales bacterium]
MNKQYFQFATRLPHPLNMLAQSKGTFEGDGDTSSFEGIFGLNPVLVATPWLFWEIFSELDDKTFLQVSEAGMYFVLASVIIDHIIDKQSDSPEAICLLHQVLYNDGVAGYRALFPSKSNFWNIFNRLANDHLVGLATEILAQSKPMTLDLESLIVMAHGKVSPIITTIAAMVEVSNQALLLDPIEASLKHIAVASQLLDDIGDWEHDLHVGHLTYFLTLLAPSKAWDSQHTPSEYDLQKRIDDDWVDVRQLQEVIDWLDRSLNAVSSINCPAWIEYVNGYRTLANNHSTSFTARHLQRVLEPFVREKWIIRP